MGRRHTGRAISGILVVDKPAGLTSNQVLQRLKRLYQAKRAGHTGILDMAATGVLPICFGHATKCASFLLDSDKRYLAKIRLGLQTDTGDATGTVTHRCPVPVLDEARIHTVLQQFHGKIPQLPPMYSAIHHNGVRLHTLARKNKVVKRSSRTVQIYSIRLLQWDTEHLNVEISCSKGTYIRVLAQDIGEHLGCGAHLNQLRRTASGPFDSTQLSSMESITECAARGLEALDALLLPIESALPDLPSLTLGPAVSTHLCMGQAVMVPKACAVPGLLRVHNQQGEIIALARVRDDGMLAPQRLLCQPGS